MKRIIVAVLLAAVCIQLPAQDKMEYLKNLVLENRVSFNYNVGVRGKAPTVMAGKAVIDGECYSIRGNGMEVYCDGVTKWTVDKSAKEVYVEAAESARDFIVNPDAWIGNVRDLKADKTSASGIYHDDYQNVDLTFRFSSIKSSPLSGSSSGFVFDTSSLDSGWVVTDLR